MSRKWKTLAVAAALALAGLSVNRAWAASASTATLNIDVTINASLSVMIDGGNSSSQTWSWSVANTSWTSNQNSSTATVKNDSGGLIENWKLSTFSTSLDLNATGSGPGSNGAWTLTPSTRSNDIGQSSFSLQAVFLSSGAAKTDCPPLSSGVWTDNGIGSMTVVGTTGVDYGSAGGTLGWYVSPYPTTSGQLASQALPDSGQGGKMSPYVSTAAPGSMTGIRALCWKVIGPSSITTSNDVQEIQLLITAH